MKDYKLLLILCLSLNLLLSCGSNDDDDDDIVVEIPQQEREEGPAPTGSVVIINKFNPTIRIINKSVEVNNNEVFFNFNIRNSDNVSHLHIVYRGRTCRELMVDRNDDDVVEREEAEQAGGPVVVLSSAQGDSYDFEDRVPAAQFPPNQENYVLVIYGTEENPNHPAACFPFQLNIEEPTTTGGTGGGTTTGGTTGTTGGTTTGTTTGGTTGGGGGSTACLNSSQIQTITSFFNSINSQDEYRGRMTIEPSPAPSGAPFNGVGSLSVLKVNGNSWRTDSSFRNVSGEGILPYRWRANITDGCLFVNGRRSNVLQASANAITLETTQARQQWTTGGDQLDIVEVTSDGVTTEIDLEAQ